MPKKQYPFTLNNKPPISKPPLKIDRAGEVGSCVVCSPVTKDFKIL